MSAVATRDDSHLFVAVGSSEPREINGIAVLTCHGDRYSFDRLIPVETGPVIIALTHDDTTLVVPDGGFIALVDVQRALADQPMR